MSKEQNDLLISIGWSVALIMRHLIAPHERRPKEMLANQMKVLVMNLKVLTPSTERESEDPPIITN